MVMILYLQLVHHFVKEFSGLGAVGVLKVIFYTDLDYNRLQVTTHTCEERAEQGVSNGARAEGWEYFMSFIPSNLKILPNPMFNPNLRSLSCPTTFWTLYKYQLK